MKHVFLKIISSFLFKILFYYDIFKNSGKQKEENKINETL